jgi:hypothetical protein
MEGNTKKQVLVPISLSPLLLLSSLLLSIQSVASHGTDCCMLAALHTQQQKRKQNKAKKKISFTSPALFSVYTYEKNDNLPPSPKKKKKDQRSLANSLITGANFQVSFLFFFKIRLCFELVG